MDNAALLAKAMTILSEFELVQRSSHDISVVIVEMGIVPDPREGKILDIVATLELS